MPTKTIVAIHGIGDQFRYATAQSVVNQFYRVLNNEEASISLGRLHSRLYAAPESLAEAVNRLHRDLAQVAGGLPTPLTLKPPEPFPAPPPFTATLQFNEAADPALAGYRFAEVYWADIPRGPAAEAHTLEETKRWAQTVVAHCHRAAAVEADADVPATGKPKRDKLNLTDADYVLAQAVLEEMIDGIGLMERICGLAAKAGLFRFDLSQVLTDYLGDVEIVAEYEAYRREILAIFSRVMSAIDAELKSDEDEIHVVAHSEGTVVALLGLLEAFVQPTPPPWLKRVRGLVTLGSPLNKHVTLWPDLWTKYEKGPTSNEKRTLIRWQNYYDYGDPVGFDLTPTRRWLGDRGWGECFELKDENDNGFARYPFPGEAHNRYWTDRSVFAHLIDTVVDPENPKAAKVLKAEPLVTRPWCNALSPALPYVLSLALCYLAVYVLHKGADHFLGWSIAPWPLTKSAVGITLQIACLTVTAHIMRLTRAGKWWVYGALIGLALLCLSGIVYGSFSDQDLLHPVGTSTMLAATAVAAVVASVIAVRLPKLGGTGGFVFLGGVVGAIVIVGTQLKQHGQANSVWPLLLAAIGCLYLWRLAAVLFDLTFIWHRYIRWATADHCLQRLIPPAARHGKAMGSSPK